MLLRNKPILLIEDDPIDTKSIKSTLETMKVKSPLVHSNNSEEALIYLKNQKNKKPWLILLGMNMQSADGIDFLKTIKTDEHLKIIPVVIIAESNEDQNIIQGFEFGVAGYIVKPQDTSKITDTIRTIMDYWNLSELPPIGDYARYDSK